MLGSVLKTRAGGTPLKAKKEYYEGGDIPWLMSGEVCTKDIYSCVNKITQLGVENSSAKLFPASTTLVAMYGATAGQVGILRFPATTNQAVCGILPCKNYLPEFLYYYLSFYKDTLLLEVSGVAQPNLSQIKIKNIPIPLISIKIQEKIVAKLDAIFAEIDTAKVAAEANANNAEALFQSFLDNLFLNIAKTNNPIKLSSVIKLEYGKGLEDNDRDLNGIYGAYGANGVKSKTNKFLYDKPSIVVGRKGSAGELTLVEEKFWALDVTYYVTHDTKKTDLNFLYYALKMLNIPSLAKGVKPGINRNDVYDLSIAVPILSDQKILLEKILYVNKNLDIAKNLYKTKVSELNFLKQSILQKAFNGELVKD